jgi:hypothetical protein
VFVTVHWPKHCSHGIELVSSPLSSWANHDDIPTASLSRSRDTPKTRACFANGPRRRGSARGERVTARVSMIRNCQSTPCSVPGRLEVGVFDARTGLLRSLTRVVSERSVDGEISSGR